MKQVDTDIAVVAAGTAGLTAAVAAAEAGAGVVVLEKASVIGGTGNMALGPFAVESRMQRQKLMTLTREEAFKIHMDFTRWRVDARLVRTFIDKTASTIDWLEKMGVEFADVKCHNPGSYFTWHVIKAPAGKTRLGATMMKILANRARELGVTFFLKTPAKKILKQGDRVVGVLAENSAQEVVRVNAGAVIIATGGFGANPEWVKRYTGYETGHDLYSRSIRGSVGDGLRMAWEAGAAKSEMLLHFTGGTVSLFSRYAKTIAYVFGQPNLMLNPQGERFMDEEIVATNPTFASNAISRQKTRCAFMILDEDTVQYYMTTGLDIPPEGPSIKAANFNAEFERALNKKTEHDIFVAGAMNELADKTGINPDALHTAITEYNQACDTGRDALFAKKARYLRPVRRPRYYVLRYHPTALASLGGIKISYKTEVLNEDFDVIPGLYAAGLDANSLYADSYNFTLPGSTMGYAINSGRMAGENAAEYIKSVRK